MRKKLSRKTVEVMFRLYMVIWFAIALGILCLINLFIMPKLLQFICFCIIVGLGYHELNWLVVKITTGILSLFIREKKKRKNSLTKP